MPIIKRIALVLAGACLILSSASASADETFRRWLEALWPEAEVFGVSRATFDRAFRGVAPDLTLPDLVLPGREKDVKGQAEFIKPPQDYLNKAYLATLAGQGRALFAERRPILLQIERELGVAPNVLLAIWGRETAFGTHKLPHYGIRVLATQAYLGRRKEMFRNELLHALKLMEDRVLSPETFKASWAGAIGLTQFMPSEYTSMAYDLDRDGRKDIWTSIPDALASAANQLKLKGWTAGQPWGFEVKLPAAVDCAMEGPQHMRSIAEWAKLGMTRVGGQPFTAEQGQLNAYLLTPGGALGPTFLATENFLVLKRYNFADLYALFVGNLADRIAGGGDFETPWRTATQLATRDLEDMQTRLKGLGYAIEKIDGKAGTNTRSQVGVYQRRNRLAVDCWPSEALLRHVRGAISKP